MDTVKDSWSVAIEEGLHGLVVKVYFYKERAKSRVFLHPTEVLDSGELVWTEVAIPEWAVAPSAFSLSKEMLHGLKQALGVSSSEAPDEKLIQTLRTQLTTESSRVDRFINHALR